jgi:hypothetical protein
MVAETMRTGTTGRRLGGRRDLAGALGAATAARVIGSPPLSGGAVMGRR